MGKILYKKGKEHGNWKGGKPKCIGCEKQLVSIYAKNCVFCAAHSRAKNPEYIKKLSESAKKRGYNNDFSLVQKKAWVVNKGRKFTEEHRKKIGDAHRGEKSYMWIKDRSKLIKRQERNDSAYYGWRAEVYKRDDFSCRIADKRCDGKIVAHHILTWSKFPELRYEVNNGITLCHFHHPLKRNDEMRLSPYFQELVLSK